MQLGFLLEFLKKTIAKSGFSKFRAWALKVIVNNLPPTQGEDCLSLVITAPPRQDDEGLNPVMVWIHGGDHQDGSGTESLWCSDVLANLGVVTVNINYRLNVFGFLSHPELAQETPLGEVPWGADAGLRDQILALQWVKKNIESFGGDPNNVTIFGESAGGESVLHLMCAPSTEGLFHRAIAQSPCCGGKFVMRTREFGLSKSAEQRGIEFATQVVGPEPGQLKRLRSLSAEHLQAAYQQFKKAGNDGFYVCHGTDQDAAIIPENPYATFMQGKQHKVPFIVGVNADEASVLGEMLDVFGPSLRFLHPMPCANSGSSTTPSEAFGAHTTHALLRLYPGLDGSSGKALQTKAKVDVLGDLYFGRYAYLLAVAHCMHAPTFLYLFKRTPKRPQQTVGAGHAMEIVFVHGSQTPLDPLDKADQELGKVMRQYWTSFARFGEPSAVGLPTWAPLLHGQKARWMEFDSGCQPYMCPVSRAEKYKNLLEPLWHQLSALHGVHLCQQFERNFCTATKTGVIAESSPALMKAANTSLLTACLHTN